MFRNYSDFFEEIAEGETAIKLREGKTVEDLKADKVDAIMIAPEKLYNTRFLSEIKDIMTGYRAFSYQFVKTFPVMSKGFEIETEMTIHAVNNNMQVENVLVDYRDRPEGSESKLNTYSDGIKVLLTIVRLFREYKPLPFFSLVSLVLIILAAVFFIPVFVEYLATGLVMKFPTLIVCGFVCLAAIQSFFSGLILNNIVQRDRKNFEMDLNRVYSEYTGKNK